MMRGAAANEANVLSRLAYCRAVAQQHRTAAAAAGLVLWGNTHLPHCASDPLIRAPYDMVSAEIRNRDWQIMEVVQELHTAEGLHKQLAGEPVR